MACAICQTRRPRRFCPGVRGHICTLCCGTEREVTVDCPLDCEYLQEAHKHEKSALAEDATLPNADIRVTDELLNDNEELMGHLVGALVGEALENPSLTDFDAREALEALIRTYRTLQTGLYYETLPANPLAAGLCRAVRAAVDECRKQETKSLGVTRTRDAAVLGLLVFLQRFELERNNGRRRCRAFLDALREIYPSEAAGGAVRGSSLLLP